MNQKMLIFILCPLFLSLSCFGEIGEIKILRLSGKAHLGLTELKAGDSIKTEGLLKLSEEKNSEIDLMYPQGHKIRLKAGSQIQIASESKNYATNLKLITGRALLHFQKTPDAKSFKIITKTAVAGVRGTKFSIEEKDGDTYLCVCEGVVELESNKLIRRVNEGQDLWARKSNPLGEPKESPGMVAPLQAEFETL